MGMFDVVLENDGTEWQTKAFNNLLDAYTVGDLVSYPLESFQFEIFGGSKLRPMKDSLATVINLQITAIDVERDPALPLVDYHGNVRKEVTQEHTKTPVPDLTTLRVRVEAGQQLTSDECKALLFHTEAAITQREAMRRSLSESAGRNIDLHQKLAKAVVEARIAERNLAADRVETWLKTGACAQCYMDHELVEFIRNAGQP